MSGSNHNLGYDVNEINSSPNQRRLNQQQQHQQMQISMENDINLTQLREREAALHKLENDITDVNMIFKDLAVMVHDQGEIIDSIESNVEQVQIRVNDANSHLIEAKKNQVRHILILGFFLIYFINLKKINKLKTKARKKKVILLGILGIIAAIIILIIVLSLKPWSS